MSKANGATAANTELAVTANSTPAFVEAYGFDPASLFDSNGFKEETVEFFKTDAMEGVEFNAFLESKISMEVKGDAKEFVRGHLITVDGPKQYYFGQHQIISAFDRNDKGKGVAAKITFEGLVKLEKGKTMNKFRIFTKSL